MKPTHIDRLEGSRRPNGGFSLVEAMVCVALLTIALAGFTGSLVASFGVNRSVHETTLAREAAQKMLETLQGRPFKEVFAAFNADKGDDAALLSPAPGANFAVAGLTPLSTDADGLCGDVEFPSAVVGGKEQLREDVVDAQLGLPLDLNGDGVIDAADHAADYKLLPVRIHVQWRSATGPRHVDISTILCAR